MKPLLLSLPILLISSSLLAQDCMEFLPNNADYAMVQIRLVNPTAFPAAVQEGIEDGMAQWNDRDCNVNGERFPSFSLAAPTGSPIIDVEWNSGVSLTLAEAGHTVCAEIPDRLPDGSSATVVLYEKTRLADGTTRNCYDSQGIASDSFAHELGHYLGLDHPSCTSQTSPMVMEVRSLGNFNGILFWETDRSVRAAECDAADNKNETPAEAECQRGDPSCDPEADNHSPIIVDLDRGGFQLTGIADSVLFDLDADGTLEWVSWLSIESGDAFLCWDRNENGLIDDGRELFGDATVLVGGALAPNGYVALAELDQPWLGGDANGFVDPGDAKYATLCLWTDRNQDGISQPDELSSLQAERLVALEYEPRESRRRDRHGNQFRFSSAAWRWHRDGVLVPLLTVDVFLRRW